MNTQQTTGRLLTLVLAAKDAIVGQQRDEFARYSELYERTGRLVALSLEDPAKAREEVLNICDLEYDLTGDTKATGDIAEFLDPEGEFFQKRSELMDRMFEVDDRNVTFLQILKTMRPTDEERSQIEALGRRETLTLRGVKLTRLDTRRYLIDGQGAELWHDELMLQLKLSPGDERDMELDALGVGDGFIVSFPDKTISVTRVV